MSYEVYCLDNFSYGEGYVWGRYETYDEALKIAKYIVDLCLLEQYKPGMAGDKLYSQFMMFGDTPLITGPENGQKFSGSDYAQGRAIEICVSTNVTGANAREVS